MCYLVSNWHSYGTSYSMLSTRILRDAISAPPCFFRKWPWPRLRRPRCLISGLVRAPESSVGYEGTAAVLQMNVLHRFRLRTVLLYKVSTTLRYLRRAGYSYLVHKVWLGTGSFHPETASYDASIYLVKHSTAQKSTKSPKQHKTAHSFLSVQSLNAQSWNFHI